MGFKHFVHKLMSGGKSPSRVFSPLEEGIWLNSADVPNIEPYTTGHVTRNFHATVEDELTIPRGSTVKAMYREDDWIYVEGPDGRRGFLPQEYCQLRVDSKEPPVGKTKISRRESQLIKKELKKQRKEVDRTHKGTMLKRSETQMYEKRWEKSNLERFLDSLPVKKDEGEIFERLPQGIVVVEYGYRAVKNDDLTVYPGEQVTILNVSDFDWTYVMNSVQEEGFVPSSYLSPRPDPINSGTRAIQTQPCELLIVEDYESRTGVDVSVPQGDWVRTVHTEIDGWIWVTRTRDGSEGFIPARIAILATDL